MTKKFQRRRFRPDGVLFCCCVEGEKSMLALGGAVACFLAKEAKQVTILDTLLLEGGLGAGKTCFARGFIQGLMGENTVIPSPTFTLVQGYQRNNVKIFHYDLYRMDSRDSLYDIGWEDVGCAGVSLIEWPERIGENDLPKDYWYLVLADGSHEHQRSVSFTKAEKREVEGLRDYLKTKNFAVTS